MAGAARDAGVFKDAEARDSALKDDDFAILVDRPEFRQVIEPPQTKALIVGRDTSVARLIRGPFQKPQQLGARS